MTNSRINAIATLIASSDIDFCELIELLHPLMPFPDYCALALQLDICPMHITDLDSCADDELTECAHLRN